MAIKILTNGAAKKAQIIMDYSCNQSAWTPQQIEKVHLNIAQRKYLYPNSFKSNVVTISGTIKQGNKVVIAKKC